MALRSIGNLLEFARRHEVNQPALIDSAAGRVVTYGELLSFAEDAAQILARGGRRLHFLLCSNQISSIVAYLGCIAAELPVCLLDGARASAAHRIVDAYEPAVVLVASSMEPPPGYRKHTALPGGCEVWERDVEPIALHPGLALMLTTSGSTGNPKLVRLTQGNVIANATAIAEYLHLTPDERSIQSLPMSYSYGLSLINSHLVAGGTTVLTPHSFLRPEFWNCFCENACTSFAGVPHMYETLRKLRFEPGKQAPLRTMTQAGGKLNEAAVEYFAHSTAGCGKRLVVMYGQTEATARISYVPPDVLQQKIGSIGIAIPGGALKLAPVDGTASMEELVYTGPNVMMGYAEDRNSLSRGDEQGGVLRTGDLARMDNDGFFYITGRLKRFAKLFGKRLNLQDIEAAVESQYGIRAAAVDSGNDHILLFVEDVPSTQGTSIAFNMATELAIPPAAIRVRHMEALPMTASGKKDYAALEQM